MDDKERQAACLSALVTEHFVLQTAASATISEAAARSSLYVVSLSSSLVAMGFASRSPDTFRLFAAAILPALFVLGLFSIVRLVAGGTAAPTPTRRMRSENRAADVGERDRRPRSL